MRTIPILALTLLLSGLSAQETAKGIFDKLTAAQKELVPQGQRPDRAKLDAFQQTVKDTLAANTAVLGEGEGVYYRARLELMARDMEAATASFKSYVVKQPDADLAHEARLMVAQLTQGEDKAGAREMIAAIKADKLSEPSKKSLEAMQKSFKAEDTRTALTGQDAPSIPAEKVLNGAADWSLAGSKGKVVVVDFWATWCPPCRGIIPDLVKMQEKHAAEGLQIVGVTRYYGSGMDFTEGDQLPHGGKSVGGRKGSGKEMAQEEEIKVNENFIKAFKLNYPVVFTGENVAGDSFGVTGIPTCYVIGRDGKIVGHIVGGGEANHAKLESMIASALGTGAAEASGHKKD
ncbi:MAG TPA: TlpA disulfide reductase family protein [Planctomycetota bacterium]|nr:TlpA disulfide reductase family protein [Planctomycetota bacterium]